MTTFSDRLYQLGGIPVGMEVLQPVKMRWVYNSSTGAIYKSLSKRVSTDDLHSTLALAEAATTAGQNEIVFVTPNETHELAASVTWDNNDTHLIGMTLNPYQPHVDFTMAAGSGFNPMITISGRGGYFANLTFRHGAPTTAGGSTGNAGDLTCATISGRYNTFDNVYFYTPLYAEQDVVTTYKGVHITGHNNYFRGCKFGSDGLARDKANFNLHIEGGVGNVFEDCIFQMKADATTPLFIYLDSILRDMKATFFKNCTFYAHSGNFAYTLADAVKTNNWDGANTASIVFDANCNFVNVSNVSDTDNDYSVWKAVSGVDNGTDTVKKQLISLRNQGA